MTAEESRMARTLYRVSRALQAHIDDAAKAANVKPHQFCPCMENELNEARTVLQQLGMLPSSGKFDELMFGCTEHDYA